MTKGNDVDLEKLVQQLAPDLLNYFLRRVGDPADAADLLGDTMLVICRRSRSIPVDQSEARLWAFGVARKTLSGRRRATRRRTALQERLRTELSGSTQRGYAEPESNADLHCALEGLDQLDREIIRLVHWEGFAQEEVATILGRPAGTIRSRYTRARAALRSQLRDLRSGAER